MGAAAIKENHVSLDDVHSCLDELDEAITVQREIEDTIGTNLPRTYCLCPTTSLIRFQYSCELS